MALLTFGAGLFSVVGCPMHYRLLNSILGLCLPDASHIPHIPVVTTKNVSRLCQMSPGGQNHLPPPTPFEKHWCNPLKYSVYRETDFKVLMCIFPVVFLPLSAVMQT